MVLCSIVGFIKRVLAINLSSFPVTDGITESLSNFHTWL